MKLTRLLGLAGLALLSLPSFAANPLVEFKTDAGNFVVEVFSDKAPITATNFLTYVDSGFYNGTIFHRIVPGFVVQGGGYTIDFQEKPTRDPIQLEVDTGLRNDYQTLSMARTEYAHSGTSQFFVNLKSNDALNPNGRNRGYAVFAKVVKGMEVIEKMAEEPRGLYRQFPEAPNYAIRILASGRIATLADASATAPVAAPQAPASKFKDAILVPAP